MYINQFPTLSLFYKLTCLGIWGDKLITMALTNLSEKERALFYEKLQYRYEAEYKTIAKENFIPWTALVNTGMNLIAKKKIQEVIKYPSQKTSNLIAFYNPCEKYNIYYLLTHLRNSIAHNNINRKVLNDIPHYQYIDKKKVNGKYQKTMKGFIKVNDWESFVDYIYEKNKALQTTFKTPSV